MQSLADFLGADTIPPMVSLDRLTAISLVLALLVTLAWTTGWFQWAIVFEILDAAGIYVVFRRSFAKFRWGAIE
jgi:hypothetical protein